MAARAQKTGHHLGPEFLQLFTRKNSSYVLKRIFQNKIVLRKNW
jgi:hypothetical protein